MLQSYNGIEEMMYEMFKESDTSTENDADQSSPKTGNEKINSTELELVCSIFVFLVFKYCRLFY